MKRRVLRRLPYDAPATSKNERSAVMSFSYESEATHQRQTSPPYTLSRSSTSSVLPTDLDILRPSLSTMNPCVRSVLYGARPDTPTLVVSEDWNHPRCWSEPSR